MCRFSRVISTVLCLAVVTTSIGCATLFGKKLPHATLRDPASEIVCLWNPAEGVDPNGMPCKGFLGTIMFLSSRNSMPLVIDGDVRVYLFDDQGTLEEQVKPLREFDFNNGAWQLHLQDTAYGPTYTVFVPYVRRGVSSAQCSLRIRFTPKEGGRPLFSEITNLSLTGHKKSTGEEAKPINAREVDSETVDAMTSALLRTTTISTGPNPQIVDKTTPVKPVTNAGQIQLAAHQTPAPNAPQNSSPDAERLRQLETMMQSMMQTMMEQKAVDQAKTEMPARNDRNPTEKNLDRTTAATTNEPAVSHRMKIRRSDDAEPRQVAPARRSHPLELDDEEPVRSRSADREELLEDSPLGEEFDSSVETTYVPRSSGQSQRSRRSAR